jgi:hypothetical protein
MENIIKNIIDGRYSCFIIKKNSPKEDFSIKGNITFGGGKIYKNVNGIIKRTNPITGETRCEGVNYVDCVFKKFDFSVFLYLRREEKIDKKDKKFFKYIEKLANKTPSNLPKILSDSPEYISYRRLHSPEKLFNNK